MPPFATGETGRVGSPNAEAQLGEAERAVELLSHFLATSEGVSLQAYRATVGGRAAE